MFVTELTFLDEISWINSSAEANLKFLSVTQS